MVFFGVILLILGILQIAIPEKMFMFGKRWQFKEGSEPSEASIFFTRASGVVIIIIGFFVMFSR